VYLVPFARRLLKNALADFLTSSSGAALVIACRQSAICSSVNLVDSSTVAASGSESVLILVFFPLVSFL
jgi:hypothetical protein